MSPVLACTSPEAIRLSVTLGYLAVLFGFATALTALVISVRRCSFAWLPFFAALLVLHPAWSVGVMRGDCGYTLRFPSAVASLAFLGLLIVQVVRPYFSIPRFVLVLFLIALVSYLPVLALHALDDDSWLDARIFVYKLSYRFSAQHMARIALTLGSASVLSLLAAGFRARSERSNKAMQRTLTR